MNDNDEPMSPAMLIWLVDDLVKHARSRGLSVDVIAAVLETAAAASRRDAASLPAEQAPLNLPCCPAAAVLPGKK